MDVTVVTEQDGRTHRVESVWATPEAAEDHVDRQCVERPSSAWGIQTLPVREDWEAGAGS